MRNHVAAGRRHDKVKGGRVEHRGASKGRAPLRALFVLIALAVFALAGAPGAAAQTITAQAYATGRQFEQEGGPCSYYLLVASASAEMKDADKTRAQALSLVLTPTHPEQGKRNYVFTVYGFGDKRFRDDDQAKYKLMASEVTPSNLTNFFTTAGCKSLPDNAEKMSALLNEKPFPTVEAFEALVSPITDEAPSPPSLIASASSPPELQVETPDSFGNFVHEFSGKLGLPPGKVLPPQLAGDDERDKERLALYWQAQSAYWRGVADARGGPLRWVSPGVIAALTTLALVLTLAYLGKRLLRRVPQREPEPKPVATLSPNEARELREILNPVNPDYIRKRGLWSSAVAEVGLNLRGRVEQFSKERRPPDLKELKSILKSFDKTYRRAKKESVQFIGVYERFWDDLEEYLIKHAPPNAETAGDGAATTQVTPGSSLSAAAEAETLTAQGGEQGVPAAMTDSPLTAQELEAQLPALALKIAGLMSGYEEQIRELGQLWSDAGETAPDKSLDLDNVVDKSKAAVSLIKLLCGRFLERGLSVEASRVKVESLFDTLDGLGMSYLTESESQGATPEKILGGIAVLLEAGKTCESQLESYRHQVQETAEKLGNLRRPNETVFYAAQRMAEDTRRALGLLDGYSTPNNFSIADPVLNLRGKAQALQDAFDAIESTIKLAAPDVAGTTDELVQHLVQEIDTARSEAAKKEAEARQEAERANELDKERQTLLAQLNSTQPEVNQSAELVGELVRRLNYNAEKSAYRVEPVKTLLGHLRCESPSAWQLRQSLSAARAALGEALGEGNRPDLIALLKLDAVTQGLGRLLELIEDFSGEDIWKKGIDSGFSTNWMHDLLRANHLLQAYFPDSELYRIRGAVTQACAALDIIMRDHGVRVAPVSIFGKPCDGMEKVNPDAALLAMPEVKVRVKAEYYTKNGSDGFVVDVKLSRVLVGDEVRVKGRAAVMIRSDWGV